MCVNGTIHPNTMKKPNAHTIKSSLFPLKRRDTFFFHFPSEPHSIAHLSSGLFFFEVLKEKKKVKERKKTYSKCKKKVIMTAREYQESQKKAIADFFIKKNNK